MACRLDGAKPLSIPMLEYFQLDSYEKKIQKILIRVQTFPFKKKHLKITSTKSRPFCLGFNMLKNFVESVHDSFHETNVYI